MLRKQTQEGTEKKTEADKCILHPKIFVAPRLDISKNSGTRLLTLCTGKEKLDCDLHVTS